MIDQDLFMDTKDFQVACCNFYEHKVVQTLLGSSFHPGGLELTKKLGEKLHFGPQDKVLDLASGLGSSALCLAEAYGVTVVGIDVSKKNVEEARKRAKEKHLDHLVTFKAGDVATLQYPNESFDYVLSECSFCLFDAKEKVGKEIYRVLKPTGRVVITDMAIEKKLPFNVEHMVFKVACIASALSSNEYAEYFKGCGFTIQSLTTHDELLLRMVEDVKKKLFVLELASGLQKIQLGSINIKEIKSWIKQANELLRDGYVTYMIMIGKKEIGFSEK